MSSHRRPHTSVPGLDADAAARVVDALVPRLACLLDLHLTLKHVHWNVVGPMFMSVHKMLDEQVGPVRKMTDEAAERIRTLGGVPRGPPQSILDVRTWDDYGLDRASVMDHLRELDRVYDGVIADQRAAIDVVGELDRVSEDMLIGHTADLELFQWFIRSFIEDARDPSTNGGSADREMTGAGATPGERRN